MSVFRSLSIEGVRMFAPCDVPSSKRNGYIEFQTPITIITGENGAGKSTIVHSLHQILVGKFEGKDIYNFLIRGDSRRDTSQARIRLDFIDRDGRKCYIERAPSISLRRGSLNPLVYHSGDPVAAFLDTNEQIPKALVDSWLLDRLGLTPALLKYVVLCDQSDSLWPVSLTSSKLMQVFNSLFGSDEYKAAMQEMQDASKDLKNQLMSLIADEKTAEFAKHEYDSLVNDTQKSSEKLAEYRNKQKQIENDITDKKYAIQTLLPHKKKVETLQLEIEESRHQVEAKQLDINKLRVRVEDSETLNVLEEEKEEIEMLLNSAIEKSQLSQQIFDNTRRERETKYMEKDKLRKEEEDYKKLREKEIITKAKLQEAQQALHSEFGSEDRDLLIERLKTLLKTAENELNTMEKEHKHALDEIKAREITLARKETEYKNKLANEMREKAEIESSLKSLMSVSNDSVQRAIESIVKLEEEIEKVENGENSPNRIMLKIRDLETQISSLKEDHKVAESRYQIALRNAENQQNAKRIERSLEEKTARLQSYLDAIGAESEITVENVYYKNLRACEIENQRLRKNRDEACQNAGQESNLLAQKKREVKSSLTKINFYVQKIKSVSEGFEGEVTESNFDEVKDSLLTACRDFKEKKRQTLELIEALSEAVTRLSQSEVHFKTYLRKSESQCRCPLCKRSFLEAERDEFIEKVIKKKLQKVPERLSAKQAKLEETRALASKFIEVEGSVDALQGLLEDLPTEISAITRLEEKSKIAKAEADKALTELEASDQVLQQLRDQKINIQRISDVSASIARDRAQLAELGLTGNELDERENTLKERENLATQIDVANQALLEANRQLHSSSTHLTSLSQKLETLKSLASEEQKKLALKNSLEARLSNLTIESDTIEITKIREEIENNKNSSSQLLDDSTKNVTDARNNLQACKNTLKRASDLIRDIDNLTSDLPPDTQPPPFESLLSDIDKHLATLDKRLARSKEDLDSTLLSIDSLKSRLSSIDIKIQRRTLEADIASLEENIERAKSEVASLMPNPEMLNEIDHLETNLLNLQTDHDILTGQIKTESDTLESLKKRLSMKSDPTSHYAALRLKKKSIELAIEELKSTKNAVKETLDQYHLKKIDEVNKVVSSLWRDVYHYHDVSEVRIEIKAGTSKERDTSTCAVMMRKGKTMMDMRSGASAGQKALASLIIRMALSEALCGRCGVIALDEPTANLDVQNMNGFTEMIVRLLKKWRKLNRKEFQMIVITHSADFVSNIMNGQEIDSYFRVVRVREGEGEEFSCIRKEDMHIQRDGY